VTLTLAPGAIFLLGFAAGAASTFIGIFIYAVTSGPKGH